MGRASESEGVAGRTVDGFLVWSRRSHMSRISGAARFWGGLLLVVPLLISTLTLTGCRTAGVRRACLKLQASPSLNIYNGQPHVTVVYLYALESRLGFEQMNVSDLLSGATPPGLVGSRLQVTVAPGEKRSVDETFPRAARQLGLVADFYRAHGDPEGSRKAIVDARCGYLRVPRLVLSQTDLLVD